MPGGRGKQVWSQLKREVALDNRPKEDLDKYDALRRKAKFSQVARQAFSNWVMQNTGTRVAAIIAPTVAQAAATMALVEAMAGMMFFTTPCVSESVNPWIPNSPARRVACSKHHVKCALLSTSNSIAGFSRGH